MPNSIVPLPLPANEPVQIYAPGSPEKTALKTRLHEMLADEVEIPLLIGGKEVRTGRLTHAVCPHDHGHRLAVVHQAGPEEVGKAIMASQEAWHDWSEADWEARASVFLKAADLLAGPCGRR